ncbi:3724_t:CDS:1, partial [Rhizophagus irregularis]
MKQFEDALTSPKLSAVRDSEIFDGVTGENFNAGLITFKLSRVVNMIGYLHVIACHS